MMSTEIKLDDLNSNAVTIQATIRGFLLRNKPIIYLYNEISNYGDLDYWFVTTIKDEEFGKSNTYTIQPGDIILRISSMRETFYKVIKKDFYQKYFTDPKFTNFLDEYYCLLSQNKWSAHEAEAMKYSELRTKLIKQHKYTLTYNDKFHPFSQLN